MNLKILITALSLSCSFAYSQTNLKGTVKDEKGNPLIGATVVLNATQGTITNGDGSYTIAVL
ncbi:carboxypeptidase regulatory-like domain-containing protein, partial [Flavobacterium sp.]|uniref:carboxypeptidase regulatory-like domain-containing protein n=1 Tax=Flavobacterium sp. TaxID=239 RepID=UPI00261A1027